MSLEHFDRCFFWPSLLLVALNLSRNEAWIVPRTYALCDDFQGVLYNQMLTLLALFCINFYIGSFLTTIL